MQKTKLLTRVARGRKLVHKKLQPNSRLVFDDVDEGQLQPERAAVQTQSGAVSAAVVKKEEGVDDDEEQEEQQEAGSQEGGIDIERSKQLLQRRDTHDKQLFQERIKRAHRVLCVLSAQLYSCSLCVLHGILSYIHRVVRVE